MEALLSAQDHLADILQTAARKRLVVFLDYDGTLTPIVPRPEDANLSEAMRDVLMALARSRTVAVVSGRGLQDVRERVRLEQLYYAGSHGFEIAGPQGFYEEYGPAHAFLADLDQAEAALHSQLDSISGAQVERKHFAIAVHFRRVREDQIPTIAAVVQAVQQAHPTLRQTGGKKVFELRPNLDWHKGTALFWLLEAMHLRRDDVLAVYIGDDDTDEDAFAAVHQDGIGILVAEDVRPTAARYVLTGTEDVRTFLAALAVTDADRYAS